MDPPPPPPPVPRRRRPSSPSSLLPSSFLSFNVRAPACAQLCSPRSHHHVSNTSRGCLCVHCWCGCCWAPQRVRKCQTTFALAQALQELHSVAAKAGLALAPEDPFPKLKRTYCWCVVGGLFRGTLGPGHCAAASVCVVCVSVVFSFVGVVSSLSHACCSGRGQWRRQRRACTSNPGS